MLSKVPREPSADFSLSQVQFSSKLNLALTHHSKHNNKSIGDSIESIRIGFDELGNLAGHPMIPRTKKEFYLSGPL